MHRNSFGITISRFDAVNDPTRKIRKLKHAHTQFWTNLQRTTYFQFQSNSNSIPNWIHGWAVAKTKTILLFELQIEKMSRGLNFRSQSLNIIEDVFGIVIVHISKLTLTTATATTVQTTVRDHCRQFFVMFISLAIFHNYHLSWFRFDAYVTLKTAFIWYFVLNFQSQFTHIQQINNHMNTQKKRK